MPKFSALPTKLRARPTLPFSDGPEPRGRLKQRLLLCGQIVLFVVCVVQVRLSHIWKDWIACDCH